jgi:beta-glucosidase
MVTFVRDLKARTRGKVILVLIQGRPRYFTNALDVVDAIVYGYLPGPEGGTGIANILFGDVNPSGKLPFAYPKQAGIVKIRYTREDSRPEYQNQWDFGFGLSYTKFEYSRLTISPEDFTLTEVRVMPCVALLSAKC